MNARVVLPCLFLLAIACATAALLNLADAADASRTAARLAVAMGMGQIALLAAAAVFWRTWLAIRIAALGAAMLFWAPVLRRYWLTPDSADPLSVLFFFAALIASAAIATQLFGYKLLPQSPAPNPQSPAPPWQFSLRQFIDMTTLAAGVLGIGRVLNFHWMHDFGLVFFLALLAFIAVFAMFLFLSCNVWWTYPVVAMAACCIMAARQHALGIPLNEVWPEAAMVWLQVSVVYAGVSVLRNSGWQLVRDQRRANITTGDYSPGVHNRRGAGAASAALRALTRT